MTCPHCGGKNFAWATRCDHCGLALDRTESNTETRPSPTREPTSPDAEGAVTPAAASQQTISLTTALMALNGVMFLVVGLGGGGLGPSVPVLIDWGANFGPLTTNGQWWRLLTATVLHANVLHLLSNLYALWYVGRLAEPLFGRPAYLLIYLLSGIAGCVASLWWHPFSAGVGASGAIFGIYGALAAWLAIRHRSMRASTAASLFSGVAAMIIYNLAFGFFQKNVDVAAHVGGLVAGLVAGSALAVPLPVTTVRWVVARAAFVGAAGLVAIGALGSRVPKVDDVPGALTRFSEAERLTNAEYEQLLAKLQQREITREQFADGIDTQILPRWNSAREALAHVRSGPEQQTIADVVTYMSLRGDALRLMAEGMRTNDASVLDAARQKTTAATAMAMTLTSRARASREASGSRASEVSISGTVKDVALPVVGAVVSLSCPARQERRVSRVYLQGCDSPRVVRTDAEGRFTFSRLAPGPYLARVKADGYLAAEQQVDGQEDATLAVHLRAAVDFGNVVSSLSTLERTTVQRLNAVLADLRAKRISNAQFAQTVEKELLPPWEARRAELTKLTLTPVEKPTADTIIEYMKLRGEAWRLLAEGVRTNNTKLMNSAKQKQDSATALAKRLAAENNSGRPSR